MTDPPGRCVTQGGSKSPGRGLPGSRPARSLRLGGRSGGSPRPGAIATSALVPCCFHHMTGPAAGQCPRGRPGPSVRQAAWGQAAARWGQTRLPAPDAVTTTVGAAVWAGNVAGARVLCGGGAAGGWTRPAPGPPLPAARAARRSQSCAIGRPTGSICTCAAGPARTSPPPSPSRHAGRGCEPAGPPARPITDRWEPADTRRGETGAAGSPGSRGRSSDNPRGPSPHREPARALHLLRPALVPRLVRGRPAARRRLASHHHMARARLRRRPPGRAARPQRSRARRGPRPLPPLPVVCQVPSWPVLLLVPGGPAARGGSGGRAGGWCGSRATARGGVPGAQAPPATAGGVPGSGGGACAPGAGPIGAVRELESPRPCVRAARNVFRSGAGYRGG